MEALDVFRKGKFVLLVLRETKLKGNEEVPGCGVNGAREGVAVLLNNVWHSALIDFRCVSSRILWIKLEFSRGKVCVVVGYGPNEGIGEEYVC